MKYTEIFYSIQGEAKNTGMLCTWLRTFSCTLECKGFGQTSPAHPETWVDPYKDVNTIDIKNLEDIPAPKFGCDSAYSWSKQFRHLAKNNTPEELAGMIRSLTPNNSFEGRIGHVFTGGEPMMHQKAIADIIRQWIKDDDFPAWVAFETNGTVKLDPDLELVLADLCSENGDNHRESVYFSISPKLLHVAGEQPEKAIKPEIISYLIAQFPSSYIKFVLNSNPDAWTQAHEVNNAVSEMIGYPRPDIWVMPVGGTFEQQDAASSGEIADMAIKLGWNVSPRVHVMLWKNDQIGR